MVVGHILTGLALGRLVWRITRDHVATAAAIFGWAISTTGLQHHFEDATLAQLWSLLWLLLWLDSLLARAWKRSIFFLLLTITTHPFSGWLALLMSLLFIVQLVTNKYTADSVKKALIPLTSITILLTIMIASVLLLRPTVIQENTTQLAIIDAIRSPYGALLLLAPLGAVYILHQLRQDASSQSVLVAWLIATAFLATNDRFNIGVETNRFFTYFFLLAITCAACAVAPVFQRALPWTAARIPILLTLAGAMVLWAWSGSANIYTFYESPSRYARLHTNEQAAFLDLSHLLPENSVLISSEANRHAEWLPIITGKTWFAIPSSDPIWHGQIQDWQQYAASHHYTHLVVLEHTEEAPEAMRLVPNPFPIVYANNAVTVYTLL
jgi:hypothetical protein